MELGTRTCTVFSQKMKSKHVATDTCQVLVCSADLRSLRGAAPDA